MSGEAKWTYGEERDFVDPQTGEVIKERPVLFEGMGKRRKVRANAMGFVVLNMDAAVTAGRVAPAPGDCRRRGPPSSAGHGPGQ